MNSPRTPERVTLYGQSPAPRPHQPEREAPSASRQSRRVKTGGSAVASIFCCLIGFVCIFILWPFGLVSVPFGVLFLIVAYFVDAKYRAAIFCGACGNDVASTSRLCPTCHASFARHATPITKADQRKATALLLGVTLPILALLLWIMSRI